MVGPHEKHKMINLLLRGGVHVNASERTRDIEIILKRGFDLNGTYLIFPIVAQAIDISCSAKRDS